MTRSTFSILSSYLSFGAILVISVALFSGCTSGPRIVESRKDPSITGPLRFKKILVIADYPIKSLRREAEDELVRQLGPGRAVNAEQVITDADRRDPAKLKAKVKESGVDGVVMLRVAGLTTESSSSPRGVELYSYDSFWNNYGREVSAGESMELASYSKRVVSIRTQIYRVADERLVWEGVTESFDPKDTQSLISDIVKTVAKRLREENLIE